MPVAPSPPLIRRLDPMSISSPYAELIEGVPVEGREIDLFGSTTRYWVYGAADAPVTIVAAHGYRGEHHGLEPVIAHGAGQRWISPDLPGFGESTPMTALPHSIDGYAQWFSAFIRELGLEGVAVILGHSFGTIVTAKAISSGLKAPALVLVNPIAISGLESPARFGTFITVNWYRLNSRLPKRLGDRLLRTRIPTRFVTISLAKTKDRALRAWIHDQHFRYFSNFYDRDFVVESFNASTEHNVGEYAAEIRIPVLLIAAELDDVTPIAAVRAMAERMDDVRLRVLTGVGHLIHYEAPKPAAAAIGDFLDELGLTGTEAPPRRGPRSPRETGEEPGQ